MNWNNPDAYPGESEEEYWARKQEEEDEERQKQSDPGILFMLASLFFFIVKIAALFGIFIYAGYLLSLKLLGEEPDKFKIWSLSILLTYLIFCIIFFLKGIVIGLRANNRKLWVLPWAICVLLCCVVPAFIIKAAFGTMFNLVQKQEIWYIGTSWVVFVISLLYIYGLYQFKTPNAPRILYWSYAMGLKASK